MPRLIDAEPIESTLDGIVRKNAGKNLDVIGYANALAEIYKAPTVDAVLVIRCKDCRHWGPRLEDNALGMCWVRGPGDIMVKREDAFCSDAERRTNDGENAETTD